MPINYRIKVVDYENNASSVTVCRQHLEMYQHQIVSMSGTEEDCDECIMVRQIFRKIPVMRAAFPHLAPSGKLNENAITLGVTEDWNIDINERE